MWFVNQVQIIIKLASVAVLGRSGILLCADRQPNERLKRHPVTENQSA